MMKLRAGRRAFYLGFAALCGIGSALPAAAQSYLADNGSNVTVDYSVLGQGAGPGPVNRAPLPGSAMPAGGCSCANAPLGVIASAPQPTFTNPFGAQVTQPPAVPPGFMAYSAAVGSSSSSGGAVVLRAPSAPTQMAANEPAPAPVEQAPAAALPSSTPTQNGSTAEATPTEPDADALPSTTPTQSEPSAPAAEAAAPTGGETPPAQPDEMPDNVPSPVEQPPVAETPPVEQAPAEQTPAAPSETQTAEVPPETPPAASTEDPEQPADQQQAAVTPDAPPAEGATPPAEGGALPAGATRILYTSESDEVPAASTGELDKIAEDLLANQDKRIQVMAFAAGTEETESKARRKSLARGLAIRSYLIKAGVPSTRIDVRALGNKVEGGPADRVDIIPAS
jgi:outer membrane protein OmpA-like peptidoglycan-associated protein